VFLDDFGDEEKYTATFEDYTEVYTNNILTGKSWSTTGTASGLVWFGTMAKSQVSDKYKEDVEAIAVFNYADITFSIARKGRVTINSVVYSIIIDDNIAGQNEIIQVLLKKYD
jgi:hypothetical protein